MNWTRYESRALTTEGWEAHKSRLLADGWGYRDTVNNVVYIRRQLKVVPMPEVTPQMLEAGYDAYLAWCASPPRSYPELFEVIYLAMHHARPLSDGPKP